MIKLENGEKINISQLEPLDRGCLYKYTRGGARYLLKVFPHDPNIVRRVNDIRSALMKLQSTRPVPVNISYRGIPVKSGWCRAKDFGFIYPSSSIVPVLVYNYVDGVTLYDYLKPGRFPPLDETRKKLARQLLVMLTYLQDAGIVHGDLYPDNFIVSGGNLYMIDLESAGVLQESRRDWLWEPLVIGKEYMFCAPPEIEKTGTPSIFSDRWVGTYLVFWTLCGFHPIPFLSKIDKEALDSLYSAVDRNEITWPPRLQTRIPFENKDYPLIRFKKFMDKYFGRTSFPRILFYTYIIGYKEYSKRPSFREVEESLRGVL
jgi:serine/threonine protein kinase